MLPENNEYNPPTKAEYPSSSHSEELSVPESIEPEAGRIVVQSTSRCEYAHAAAKLLCTCYTQQTSEKTKRSKLQLVNPSLEYLRARLTTINNAAGITRELSAPVCEAMVGMHAYTGCDTTSAFSGRGKKLAFQLITKQTP